MLSLGHCILGLWFGCKDQASFGTNNNFEVDSMACPRAFTGRGCDSPNIKENTKNINVNKDIPCRQGYPFLSFQGRQCVQGKEGRGY